MLLLSNILLFISLTGFIYIILLIIRDFIEGNNYFYYKRKTKLLKLYNNDFVYNLINLFITTKSLYIKNGNAEEDSNLFTANLYFNLKRYIIIMDTDSKSLIISDKEVIFFIKESESMTKGYINIFMYLKLIKFARLFNKYIKLEGNTFITKKVKIEGCWERKNGEEIFNV